MSVPRASLRAFLSTAKDAVENSLKQVSTTNSSPPLTFVIGNESADLDSLVSAVLFSYLRTYTSTATPPRLYIPLSNLPAADLSIRPELLPLLKRANLSTSDLLTLSSLPSLTSIATHLPPQSTRWILVDHNALQGTLGQVYSKNVVGCIDHHEEENAVPHDAKDEPRVVEKCGSCASLVVAYCREAWEKLSQNDSSNSVDSVTWDAELAHLALGPVLIDTTSLRSKEKTREVDIRAVDYLEGLIRKKEGVVYDREIYFTEISKAKEAIGDLPLQDILRKDYKQWAASQGLKLGVSSVVKDIRFLIAKAGNEKTFLDECEKFARERALSIFSIMTTSHPSGQFQRELLVWALDGKGVEAATRFEESATEKLGLQAWEDASLDARDAGQWRRCWKQSRLENSRKQVAPLLRAAMEG